MRENLQDMIAAVPAGGRLDLGAREYTDNLNPLADQGVKINKTITMTCEGAKLFTTHSQLRNRPAILLTELATNAKIVGHLDIIGPDATKNRHFEAQHGVEMRGTEGAVVNGVGCENMQGNSYYLGKGSKNQPCKNIILGNPRSVNAGRGHIGLQCVENVHIVQPYMDTCGHGHSSIVYEPNGVSDHCWDVLVEDGFYRGNTGECFSAGSEHSGLHNGNLARVTLMRMKSKGAFGIHLGTGPSDRCGPFTAKFCEGQSVTNRACVRAWKYDGLVITEYKNPMTVPTPFELHDCPDAITSLAA